MDICFCQCVCVCVHLIRPTAEDSSLANYTEFSFSSLSLLSLPKQTQPFAYCLMNYKLSTPPKEKISLIEVMHHTVC